MCARARGTAHTHTHMTLLRATGGEKDADRLAMVPRACERERERERDRFPDSLQNLVGEGANWREKARDSRVSLVVEARDAARDWFAQNVDVGNATFAAIQRIRSCHRASVKALHTRIFRIFRIENPLSRKLQSELESRKGNVSLCW